MLHYWSLYFRNHFSDLIPVDLLLLDSPYLVRNARHFQQLRGRKHWSCWKPNLPIDIMCLSGDMLFNVFPLYFALEINHYSFKILDFPYSNIHYQRVISSYFGERENSSVLYRTGRKYAIYESRLHTIELCKTPSSNI